MNRPSLTTRTLRGLMWNSAGAGANGVLQLLVVAILARLLTPADFGVVSAALIAIGFSAIFSQLGVAPAIVQRVTLTPMHLRTGFTFSLSLGLVTTATVWLLAPVLAAFFRMPVLTPVLHALSPVFLLSSIGIVAEACLQRELRFERLATLEVVSYALGYGAVGVTMAALGAGVWALVAAHLGQALVKTTLLLALGRPPLRPGFAPDAARDLIHYGAGFSLARTANYLATQGDNLMVGKLLGAAALGIYGRAYQFVAVPAQLLGRVVDRVLFAALAKVQREPARLQLAYRRSVALTALVMLPTSAMLVVLAPEIVMVLLGPQWGEVVAPFRILALGLLFRTSYKMSDSLARATGAVYRRAVRQFAYAALVLAGAYLGASYGVEGVAGGVLFAIAVNFALMAQLSLKLTALSWRSYGLAHLPGFGLAAVTGSVSWVVAALGGSWHFPAVATLAVSLAVALLAALLLWLRWPGFFLGDDGHWMLATLKSHLRWHSRPLEQV